MNRKEEAMHIIAQSKTVAVTEALRLFIESQARKILRTRGGILKIRLFLESVGKKHNDPQATIVKCQVEVAGKDIMVRSRSRDMYQAIVDVMNAAARRVRKSKEKRFSRRRSHAHHSHEALVGQWAEVSPAL